MKRASGGMKRNTKSKNLNKGRTFLNRPSPSNTGQPQNRINSPSKGKSLLKRPDPSNTAKPQNRQIQSKAASVKNQPSPPKSVQPQDRLQSYLDGFLKFDGGNLEIKQEDNEMQSAEEEELVEIDFDINGQTISAKMASSMVQLLNEDECLREQIIEKLVADSEANPGEHVIITVPNLNNAVGEDSEQREGYTKSKKKGLTLEGTKRIKPPVGNRSVVPVMRDGLTDPNDTVTMWGDETVITLLEVYEATKKQLEHKKPSSLHFWRVLCKNMKKKGYVRLTDVECQTKFKSMEAIYKEQVAHGFTAQTSTWDYFNTMAYLTNENSETTPIVPITIPKDPIVDPTNSSMYESDGASVSSSESDMSDEDIVNDGVDFNNSTNDQPNKKKKTDLPEEISDVEKLRRTYLKVETKKLGEMKAMRKLQKQQSRLQAERNILLSTIVDLLRKNSLIVRRR